MTLGTTVQNKGSLIFVHSCNFVSRLSNAFCEFYTDSQHQHRHRQLKIWSHIVWRWIYVMFDVPSCSVSFCLGCPGGFLIGWGMNALGRPWPSPRTGLGRVVRVRGLFDVSWRGWGTEHAGCQVARDWWKRTAERVPLESPFGPLGILWSFGPFPLSCLSWYTVRVRAFEIFEFVCRWMGLGQFRYLFPVAHILFSYWWATFRFCRLQVHHQPVEWIWLAGGTSLVILLEQRIPHLSVRISSFRCQNTTTHQTKTFSFFCAVADDPHQSRS